MEGWGWGGGRYCVWEGEVVSKNELARAS